LPTFRRSRDSWTSFRTAAEEKGGPLVVKLPRAPGAREQRWAHLLCGPVDMALAAAGAYEARYARMTRAAGSAHAHSLEDEVAAAAFCTAKCP
jgi:uncharacterized protein YceH (UPF0502 family)